MTARTLALGVLLCTSALSASAQSPEQLCMKADSLYADTLFTRARDLYELVVANGYVSGDLFYNLGNTYYRLGDLGHAILNYERARRLIPGDEDLRYNLALANLRVVDRIEPTPRLFLWDWWDGIKGTIPSQSVVWIAYTFFVLLVAGAITMMLGQTYTVRKVALIAIMIAGVLFAFSLVLGWQKIAEESRRDEAIVVADITTVKNSPDARSTDAFVLHAGIKVRMIDSVNDWVQIRLADGKVGWMERAAVATI